jgi:molybdate transport system substrate-binding protein
VLKTIGDQYAAAGHPAPVLNFAASSELARQIEQGAEADVFISADEAWMDYLAERSLIDAATRATLLANTLVLIAPADKPIIVEIKQGMDLKAALKGGKLAIANPDSVPAGKYAKEALEHFGAWAGVDAETARAENVRAALRFVEQGEAAAGIVYATDAKAAGSAVTLVAAFPSDSHTPITYPAAVVAGKGEGPGKQFLAFLGSPDAESAFQRAGFGLH